MEKKMESAIQGLGFWVDSRFDPNVLWRNHAGSSRLTQALLLNPKPLNRMVLSSNKGTFARACTVLTMSLQIREFLTIG